MMEWYARAPRGRNAMDELILRRRSGSEEETEEIDCALAERLTAGDFLWLSGEMGAGKTAFVRGLCRFLCPGARVQSPTYTVMRDYPGRSCRVYHFDMYRISSPEDLESVGFYDCDGIIAAEWCENTPFALPDRYYLVRIEKGKSERERTVTVTLRDFTKEGAENVHPGS